MKVLHTEDDEFSMRDSVVTTKLEDGDIIPVLGNYIFVNARIHLVMGMDWLADDTLRLRLRNTKQP